MSSAPPGFDPDKFRIHRIKDPYVIGKQTGGKGGRVWSEQSKAKKVALLTYLVQGYSIKEAGDAIGVSYSTARSYARDPEVLTQLKTLATEVYKSVYGEVVERKVEAHDRILEMADQALTTLEELLDSNNDGVRLKAAQDVLDRHGEVPRQTKSTGPAGVQVNISAEMLAIAVQGAREIEGTRKVQKLIKADEVIPVVPEASR